MTFLFFDTETTGLPRTFDAPVTDLSNWPRIVQLAWLLADESGTTISQHCYTIRPQGFQIPEGLIHGISHATALLHGKELHAVLDFFERGFLRRADRLIAHNYDFDAPVLGAEFLRAFGRNPVPTVAAHCTQKQTTDWAEIPNSKGPGNGRYKRPSLAELHRICGFGEIQNAHDALADTEATAKCFFHIRQHSPAVFYAPYKPARK